jgi:hypothetical protein
MDVNRRPNNRLRQRTLLQHEELRETPWSSVLSVLKP